MKLKSRRELQRTKIEIIPMIDTIFFLLVFFMLSSLSLTRINGLKVNLPKTATALPESEPRLMLTITADQTLSLNQKAVLIEDLERYLEEELRVNNMAPDEAMFVVNADEAVSHGIVVKAIDISRKVGVVHFAIATSTKHEPDGK